MTYQTRYYSNIKRIFWRTHPQKWWFANDWNFLWTQELCVYV